MTQTNRTVVWMWPISGPVSQGRVTLRLYNRPPERTRHPCRHQLSRLTFSEFLSQVGKKIYLFLKSFTIITDKEYFSGT